MNRLGNGARRRVRVVPRLSPVLHQANDDVDAPSELDGSEALRTGRPCALQSTLQHVAEQNRGIGSHGVATGGAEQRPDRNATSLANRSRSGISMADQVCAACSRFMLLRSTFATKRAMSLTCSRVPQRGRADRRTDAKRHRGDELGDRDRRRGVALARSFVRVAAALTRPIAATVAPFVPRLRGAFHQALKMSNLI